MDPATLALPLMHLPNANVSAARAIFNDWISAYDDIGSEWDSDVPRDVFIAVDDAAMESLDAVDGSGEPWVLVVDAKYSESVMVRQDYPGYMRCLARSLWTLSNYLENGDRQLEALTPARQYADQTPLFDGSPKRKVYEPEQPTRGARVEFSRGTQRDVGAGTQRGVQGGTQRGV